MDRSAFICASAARCTHLTSGFVTLRLDLAAFLELAVVVNQGHSALTAQNIPILQ
jgi:hypothetical protein